MRTLRTSATSSLILLALSASAASAGDDVELVRGEALASTIRPAREIETYLLRVPGGAALRVVAAAKGPLGKIGLGLSYPQDPTPDPVARNRRATLSFPAEATTKIRRISVGGDRSHSGDFTLRISWTTPRRLTFVQDTPETLGTPITLSGERGTRFRFRLSGVDDTGAPLTVTLSGAADVVDGGEFVVPEAGEYVFTPAAQGGGTPRSFQVVADVRPPKPAPRSLDRRDARRGGTRLAARRIGSAGGRIDVVGAGAATNVARDLGGASLVVPAGAVAAATLFELAPGEDVVSDDPASLSIALRCEEQTPAVPVTLTLPYDATAFEGTPVQPSVRARDAAGAAMVTGPLTVDSDAGTVSFTAPAAGTFQVQGPARSLATEAIAGGGASMLRAGKGGRYSFVARTRLYDFRPGVQSVELVETPPARSAVAAPDGGYYVATTTNRIVLTQTSGGAVEIAGTGGTGSSGDGGAPLAARMQPADLAVEPSGTILVLDAASASLRRIDRAVPRIDQVAALAGMRSVLVAPDGTVLVSTDTAIWALNPAQDGFDRVAGNPDEPAPGATDGGPLHSIRFGRIAGIAASTGDRGLVVHVADAGRHCVWRVDVARDRGFIVAGTDGKPGYDGDGAAGHLPGRFRAPSGIAWLGTGVDVAILDEGSERIRMIREP